MIHLTKGLTDNIVLTLSEKCTLTLPNYLFICTSRSSKIAYKFLVLGSSDLSAYKERFNSFNLITNNHFSNALVGEYTYTIYEQASTSNLDPTLAVGIVEQGQMTLQDSSQFAFNTYNQVNNTFKVRDI